MEYIFGLLLALAISFSLAALLVGVGMLLRHVLPASHRWRTALDNAKLFHAARTVVERTEPIGAFVIIVIVLVIGFVYS